MSIDQRTLDLQQIAIDIEKMVNRHIVDPITIVYVQMTKKVREENRQLQRFRVTVGDEYFMISRGETLLYVVNVTADSYITAAHELMAQLARKF